MKKEIIFSNLNEFIEEKNNIDGKVTKDKWTYMPYEAGKIKGNFLLAGEMTSPSDVTVKLNLTGWHKIFVSTINMRSLNYFLMKLSGDEGFTGMRSPVRGKKFQWSPVEYAEEFFWKCADLSGEDIIISKPNDRQLNACTVLWIRCVPMTDEQVEKYKNRKSAGNIHAHIDEDSNLEDRAGSTNARLTRVYPLKNTDISECSIEISFDYDTPKQDDVVTILQREHAWYKGDVEFQKVKETAYRERVDFLHKNNIRVYAANRMSMCEFTPPYSNPYWTEKSFPHNNPQYYCVMRDKSKTAVCSYAFDKVREYVINTLASYIKFGFDGFTLIYNRGMHIGFEEPVIDRFTKKYPGVDPFALPVKDSRLSGIWCEIMTEFMRELKEKLCKEAGREIEINVVVEYSPETCKNFGLDVEMWAKEGLINRVLQGNMEVYEHLDGCLNNDGSINLQKYKEKLLKEPIIRRYYFTNMEKVLSGAKQYKEICDKYNVELYGALPWEHTVDSCEYPEIMNKLREIGVNKFHSWNTNHVMYDVPEFHAMSLSGAEKADEEVYRVNYYRVLSLAGSNISAFDPNWRG